ncbi:MAG: GlsB/YeaQ/YmgE family stress response membrane protein [Bacteroidetes bacterium]|nr:GlsB/YeaQ/YmgE family stress response membrane protein [Bacteroidota bacterium]
MGIISWIILGGIAGWIAKTVTGVGKEMGCLFNILIGILGSVVGGLLFNYLGHDSVTGFNPWSLFVATIGAIAFLWIASLLGVGRK